MTNKNTQKAQKLGEINLGNDLDLIQVIVDLAKYTWIYVKKMISDLMLYLFCL